MPKTIIAVFLVIAAFAGLSLAFGAAYLEETLPGGLPLGNALTALGLCAAAGAAIGLSARGTALRSMSLVSLIAAAAWLPASVVLAGNLALNFGGARGLAWVALSLAVVVGVLCVLVWALAVSLLAMLRRAGAA